MLRGAQSFLIPVGNEPLSHLEIPDGADRGVIGLLYTLPNFFGESPAVQVSSAKATLKIDLASLDRVQTILKQADIPNTGATFELNGTVGTVRVRFPTTDIQLKARDLD